MNIGPRSVSILAGALLSAGALFAGITHADFAPHGDALAAGAAASMEAPSSGFAVIASPISQPTGALEATSSQALVGEAMVDGKLSQLRTELLSRIDALSVSSSGAPDSDGYVPRELFSQQIDAVYRDMARISAGERVTISNLSGGSATGSTTGEYLSVSGGSLLGALSVPTVTSSTTVSNVIGLSSSGKSTYDAHISSTGGGPSADHGILNFASSGGLFSTYDGTPQFGIDNTIGASEYWMASGGVAGTGATLVARNADLSGNVQGNFASSGTGGFNWWNGSGQLFALGDPGGAVTSWITAYPGTAAKRAKIAALTSMDLDVATGSAGRLTAGGSTVVQWTQSGTSITGNESVSGGFGVGGSNATAGSVLINGPSGDATSLTVNAPNASNSSALSIYAPLGGKAFAITATGENIARGMFYVDGSYGVGPGGSYGRDTYVSRSSTSTLLVSSDLSTGAATLSVTGRIGIGTTSPYAKLSVTGDAVLSASSPSLYLSDTVSGSLNSVQNASGALQFNTGSGNSIVFQQGGVEAARFLTGTRAFGIGTTTPFAKFSIAANSGDTAKTLFAIGSSTASATTTLASIDNAGNAYFAGSVGVGVSPPTYPLSVLTPNNSGVMIRKTSGAYGSTGLYLGASGSETAGIKSGIFFNYFNGSTFGIGDMQFAVNGSADVTSVSLADTKLIIKSTGNVGVGTTSPWRKLSIAGSVGLDGLTAGIGTGSLCLNADKEVVFNSGSDNCLSSLRSTKHAIAALDIDAMAQVLALQPASFIYNNDPSDSVRYGFIAEDAAAVDRHLATYNASGDLSGVDDRAVISVVVRALQSVVRIAGGFKDNLVAWLGDASNGIGKIFAEEVDAGKLCAKNSDGSYTCVTGDQLAGAIAGHTTTTGTQGGDTESSQSQAAASSTPAAPGDNESSYSSGESAATSTSSVESAATSTSSGESAATSTGTTTAQ